MRPLIPTREEFLGTPRRVSRLFVILFILTATLNALLAVGYGYELLVREQIIRQADRDLATAFAQASRYKSERDTAQASAEEKSAQLKEVNAALTTAKKQLTALDSQIKSQESQLAANSAELSALRARPPLFSFQKNTGREVTADEAAVREIVTASYDVIREIYGAPYILHQITISFVDALTIGGASGEITITNSSEGLNITIKMISFDKNSFADVNTVIHEIIHGFRGLAALTAPIVEEGSAVAATDVVLERLSAAGVIPFTQRYINLTDEQAAQLNATLERPPANNALYQSARVADYYQLAGWAWQQLYEENPSFFSSFNERLYDRVIAGQSATPDLVRQLITETVPTVNNQPTADWLAGQISFDPQ